MKNRSLLLATTATALLILPVGGVFAAGDAGMSGSVELGARLADGEDESAKFMEYRDLESGGIGNFLFNYYREALFFDAEATNIGLDDQFYQLKGGMYGSYRYRFFYNEIPHNLSFDARTFYSEVGTGDLNIGALDPDDESTWRTFDYSVDSEQYGGDVEFFRGSPFFLRLNVDRDEKDGYRPLGSGSFSGVVEMPEPVDSTTDNFSLLAGYRGETMSLKFTGMYSSFDKDQNAIEWDNPHIGITEHNSLAQDNDYGKLGVDFTMRQLPMMSTLMLKGTYTNLSSDYSTNDLGASLPSGLNTTEFDGDVSTTRFSAALASMPIDSLDTRLFFDYFDRDNDSTVIAYDDGGNDIHLYSYDKYTLGLDADYKINSSNKLSGGYEFENVDRTNRHDAESNQDNLFFVKYKNTSLDFLTAKVGYSYLNRDADKEIDQTLTPSDAAFINRFVDRFDAASKSKHELEFAVEVYPFDSLDFGVSYTFVNNDYDDAILGRTEDTGHEFYVDATWRASKMLTLTGFAGYENYESDSNHFNYRAGFEGQTANPLVDDGNPSSFRWSQNDEEDFWTVGLNARVPLIRERLLLSLLFQYQESDGSSDFTTEGTSPLESIDDHEDYYITTFETKATYAITEAWALNVGYLYEESDYDDRQYLGYELSPGGALLTGAYSDHDYEAHVGYVTVKYSF